MRYYTSPEVARVLGLSRDAYGSLTRRAVHDPGSAPAWWLPLMYQAGAASPTTPALAGIA